MKKQLHILMVLTFLYGPSFSQQAPVTMDTELERLLKTKDIPTYIKGSVVEQISSYDRKGGNNDGFEGDWSYIRRNKDSSLVIFEASGKGVIERIWTPTPTNDTLDFYFDGAARPSFSIMYNDLFSGKISPFLNPVAGKKVGGWYSYLPIPFANGCRIVFRGKNMLFYQIQFRQYENNKNVKTFSPKLSATSKNILDKIIARWSKATTQPSDHDGGKLNSLDYSGKLKPGDTITLANIRIPGRIASIGLSPANVFEGLRNDFDIRITWDDEKIPAVYAPVADFFGYAFGTVSMKSLLIGVSNNTAYSFIPMPFDRSAKLELIYRKDGNDQPEVSLKSNINYTKDKRVAQNEGKFYAYWKRESPASGEPYVFLNGTGTGHYIGTLLWSQGKSYEYFTEFFEGDDSTVLDGTHLLHGTGSEDYFNGGWYAQPNGWVERKGAPLHGCLDYSLPFSRTGGYRFYMLDKLPFQQSIYHSIEHGPVNNNRKVEYTSIAMYYADKPLVSGTAPANETARIFVPDTLSFYPRLMSHLSYEGNARLVNGNAELDKNSEGIVAIDVRELNPGKYKLYLHGKGTNLVQVGINSSTRSNQLQTPVDETMNDVLIGSTDIMNPQVSVKVHINSGPDKLIFNRIFFVKE